jgi:hypothetical protein
MSDIRVGKSIYMRKQLGESAAFQDSQCRFSVHWAKSEELAHNGRNRHGERGLVIGSQDKSTMIDLTWRSFVPV